MGLFEMGFNDPLAKKLRSKDPLYEESVGEAFEDVGEGLSAIPAGVEAAEEAGGAGVKTQETEKRAREDAIRRAQAARRRSAVFSGTTRNQPTLLGQGY
jgi:hypothetical protein